MNVYKRYALFVILNGGVVFGSLCLFFPGKSSFAQLLPVLLMAACVILGQYPALLLARSWWIKSGIFYLSMVLFFALFGLVVGWNIESGGSEAGSWAARVNSVVAMILFGHIFGGWLLPVVILMNWLFRKSLFENQVGAPLEPAGSLHPDDK